MLTNAEMDSRATFACLLLGQPTLRRKLRQGPRHHSKLVRRLRRNYSIVRLPMIVHQGITAIGVPSQLDRGVTTL